MAVVLQRAHWFMCTIVMLMLCFSGVDCQQQQRGVQVSILAVVLSRTTTPFLILFFF